MMNDKFDLLKSLLEASIDKNGNMELTTQHLLNMMRMVDREYERISVLEQELDRILINECMGA